MYHSLEMHRDWTTNAGGTNAGLFAGRCKRVREDHIAILSGHARTGKSLD